MSLPCTESKRARRNALRYAYRFTLSKVIDFLNVRRLKVLYQHCLVILLKINERK